MKKLFLGAALLLASMSASAAGVQTSDEFYAFYDFVDRNLSGGLGVGIALVAFLVSAGVAAYMSSAKPMIGGIVIAIFFAFGPAIIENLVAGSVEIVVSAATIPGVLAVIPGL